MSKTQADDRKGGYSLGQDEAQALVPIFEAASKSRNIRRRDFAIWILGEIAKGNDIWLSASDSAINARGRHQLADHALEDGCKKLKMPTLELGDLVALTEAGYKVFGVDLHELKTTLDEIANPQDQLTEADVEAARITSDESFTPVQEVPQVTLDDLRNVLQVIDYASNRGAFTAADMSKVGRVFDKIQAFVGAHTPTEEVDAVEAEQ